MACVLKVPHEDSPGIIVFTHKERRFLATKVRPATAAIRKLHERYVLGMHWGAYFTGVVAPSIIDFHLAGQGTVSFEVPVRSLPLCSRNFTPRCFQATGQPKYWDVLNVSRPLRQKRLDDFLEVVRRVYDRGYALRVLLICPEPENMKDSSRWYQELENDYRSFFSDRERQNFSIMRLRHGPQGTFPLTQQTMAYFYNASKLFCLFSEYEGESRVIAEALMCGLPVVVRKTLLGGGRDYLNSENSLQFQTLDEAAEQFIEIATNYDRHRFDPSSLSEQLSETFTTAKFRYAMESLFRQLGYPWKGEMTLENLARRLPSHDITLPAHLREAETNDLRSLATMLLFAQQLSGEPVRFSDRVRTLLWDALDSTRRAGVSSARRAKRRLRSPQSLGAQRWRARTGVS